MRLPHRRVARLVRALGPEHISRMKKFLESTRLSPKGVSFERARNLFDHAGNTARETQVVRRHQLGARTSRAPTNYSAGRNAGNGSAGNAGVDAAAAGDPKHGAEAQQLWQEHQAFRAAFSSPDEARAIKELFPGGAQEAQPCGRRRRRWTRLTRRFIPGDARAQSEVVAELARANPAAFRSLFARSGEGVGGMGTRSVA